MNTNYLYFHTLGWRPRQLIHSNPRQLILIFFILIIITSCTKNVTLDIPSPEQKIVVEGYIENGIPPYITLTRSIPFYGEINFNNIEDYYIHDAVITISTGTDTVALTEFCLEDIPEALKPVAAEFLGIQLDSSGNFPVNICLYTVPDIFSGLPAFTGEAGKIYNLKILTEGKTITAQTSVPNPVYLDSIYYKPNEDTSADSLVRLYVTFTDPDTLGNYYREFTSRNGEPFYHDYSSVSDDLFYNGKTFDFPVNRGMATTEDYNADTYGFFWRGDTVILKFSSIDRASYDFWRSLEFDSGTDGPFSSATLIQSNIIGGIGIWCGYGSTYDTLYIPYSL